MNNKPSMISPNGILAFVRKAVAILFILISALPVMPGIQGYWAGRSMLIEVLIWTIDNMSGVVGWCFLVKYITLEHEGDEGASRPKLYQITMGIFFLKIMLLFVLFVYFCYHNPSEARSAGLE
jgi:hypothetical protein